MKYNKLVSPVLKWVGGKRQLLPQISRRTPSSYTIYYEPFVGGGAVLFNLQPRKAIINDLNSELINLYQVIKDDVEALIQDLARHKNEADYFYDVRAWDRDAAFYNQLSSVQRASRIQYLNKTCYNGLFRVNQAGQFNAPFGRHKKPNIQNAITLRAVSKYFNHIDVEFKNTDFEESVEDICEDSFVYFDPPYDPVSDSANFTGYAQAGFNRDEQKRLKSLCDWLHKKQVKFLLSNAATDFIVDLYAEYTIEMIDAKRMINSNTKARGVVPEVLVRNYE